MAVQLDVERVFLAPLGTKTLALRRFADRAVTLISVLAVVFVSLLTMCLARIKRRDRNAVVQSILARADSLEMLRINAGAIAADMIDDQSFTNLTIGEKPSYSMRPAIHSSKVEGAVAVSIQRPLPFVALPLGNPFCVKPFNLSHGASCKVLKATWSAGERQYAMV